jgi:membrane fusion protein (multidrug efflux system)
MKTRSKVMIALLPTLLVAAAVYKISTAEGPADTKKQNVPLVKVEAPKRETIVQSLNLTGDIGPIQQAQVFAKVYGNLEAVYVNLGDAVRKGQVLALVDTTELAQQFQEASASFSNASSQYDRAKALKEKGLVSQQDFDNSETAYKVAKSGLDNARTRLDYAKVTAPFSGIITKRYYDPGAVLTSTNATLFTLMDIDVMKVLVSVLEKDIPRAKIGTEVIVSVDAYPDKEFTGKLVRLAEAVDLSTRTMAVEVDIPNPDHLLKPGMFGTVSIIIDRKSDAVTVPTQAILRDGQGPYVLVADSSKARRVGVTVGADQSSRTEIREGLDGSESIITTGQQYARDGGQIRIQGQGK